MWSMIGPACCLHALASARSDCSQAASSAPVIGNARPVSTPSDASRLSKQRSGVLRMIPRGSKPTRSYRARTSGENKNGPAPRTMSIPDPPGPPGLRNTEPRRRDGSVAGSRANLSLIVAPWGWS
jgi:hypothetical protein